MMVLEKFLERLVRIEVSQPDIWNVEKAIRCSEDSMNDKVLTYLIIR